MQPTPSSSWRACAAARCWRFRCPSGRSRHKDWHCAPRNTPARAGRARNGPSRAPLASCGRGRERPVVHVRVRVTSGVSTEMPSSWQRRSDGTQEPDRREGVGGQPCVGVSPAQQAAHEHSRNASTAKGRRDDLADRNAAAGASSSGSVAPAAEVRSARS